MGASNSEIESILSVHLADYRSAVKACWLDRWRARKTVYDTARIHYRDLGVDANWEARNTPAIKAVLDAIDESIKGKGHEDLWRQE